MADTESKEDLFDFDEEALEKSVSKVADEVTNVATEGLGKICQSLLVEGNSVQDLLGLKPEQVEGVYGQAYRLFNNGQYEQAKEIFRLLCTMDLQEPKYPLGVAACLHMEKKYTLAVLMYQSALILDPKNPVPHYHSADCYMQEQQWEPAIESLKEAIKLSGKDPKFIIIKDRAKMTLQRAEQMLAAEKKDNKKDQKPAPSNKSPESK
jgi:type III secretion system low calcium response chaperone LcrH/SycD